MRHVVKLQRSQQTDVSKCRSCAAQHRAPAYLLGSAPIGNSGVDTNQINNLQANLKARAAPVHF